MKPSVRPQKDRWLTQPPPDEWPQPLSDVLQLYWLVKRNANALVAGHHREVCLSQAVFLAIQSQMIFGLEDFKILECGEGFYTHAVRHGNVSACRSFEAALVRKPFFFSDGKTRCTVGTSFQWEGKRVEVTSFVNLGTEGWHVIACQYDNKGVEDIDKIADSLKRLTGRNLNPNAPTKKHRLSYDQIRSCAPGTLPPDWSR